MPEYIINILTGIRQWVNTRIDEAVSDITSESLTEDEVSAIINGVDLEAKYITFDISNVEKKAYRYPTGDVAGSNSERTLCFSLTDGTKYYVAYDGSNGAWSDTTSVLLQGSNVYTSTTTSGTAVSTISGGTSGFVVASVVVSIDGVSTRLVSGKTFSQLGYSAMYSQNHYDSSEHEDETTYSVLSSQPTANGVYYTTCTDSYVAPPEVYIDGTAIEVSGNQTFSGLGYSSQNPLYRVETREIPNKSDYVDVSEVDYSNVVTDGNYYTANSVTIPTNALDYLLNIAGRFVPDYNSGYANMGNTRIDICLGFLVGWIGSISSDHQSAMDEMLTLFENLYLMSNSNFYSQGVSIGQSYAAGEIALSVPYSVAGYIDGFYGSDGDKHDFLSNDEYDEIYATCLNIRDTYIAPYCLGGGKEIVPFPPGPMMSERSWIGNTIMNLFLNDSSVNSMEYMYNFGEPYAIEDYPNYIVPDWYYGWQQGYNDYEQLT